MMMNIVWISIVALFVGCTGENAGGALRGRGLTKVTGDLTVSNDNTFSLTLEKLLDTRVDKAPTNEVHHSRLHDLIEHLNQAEAAQAVSDKILQVGPEGALPPTEGSEAPAEEVPAEEVPAETAPAETAPAETAPEDPAAAEAAVAEAAAAEAATTEPPLMTETQVIIHSVLAGVFVLVLIVLYFTSSKPNKVATEESA